MAWNFSCAVGSLGFLSGDGGWSGTARGGDSTQSPQEEARGEVAAYQDGG